MKSSLPYIFCLLFIFGCEPEQDKDWVVITEKQYMPYESGSGATSEREKYLLYVERLNKKPFLFSETMILEVNKESYLKLVIGDTLNERH